MAKVAITEQYLKDIADAIRTRKGAIGNIATPNMANGILNIAGGTGAFKVNSIEAIENLEDMQEGDYCVVDNIDTYLLYQYNNNAWGDVTDEILYPSINVAPTTNNQTVEIPEGYKGLNVVNIDAVTSAIDANITPANIRLGASILGVEGNCEPDKPDQSKTVTPTTTNQTIYPDTGYELGSVVVEGVTANIDQNITPANIKKQTAILGVNGEYTTNAYKVSSAEEMNAIDDMEEGDYCVITSPRPEVVIPESGTFQAFTGSIASILAGDYDDCLFVIRVYCNHYGTSYEQIIDSLYDTGDLNVWLNSSNVSEITYSSINSNKSGIWKLGTTSDGKKYLQSLNGKYLLGSTGFNLSYTYPSNESSLAYIHPNSYKKSGTTRTYRLYMGNTGTYFLHGYLWRNYALLSASNQDDDVFIYFLRTGLSTPKYLIYKYINNTWVDVSDENLYSLLPVTPTTSARTYYAPAGYRGLYSVSVGAIQTETKSTTPTTAQQTITPSANKYLTSVTVNAAPLDAAQTITPNASTQVISPTGSNIGLSSVTINPVLTSNLNITPSTNAQTFSPTGVDMGFNVINIAAVDNTIDSNITPNNIKAGVNILGITGNLEGDPEELNNAQAIVTNILEGYGGE